MPRAPRVHFPGALFHAMARGNGGQRIFFDERDYSAFLDILALVKGRKPFKLYAYCLMPNHFHLLIEMEKFPIWSVMQRVMVRFAKRSNIRRGRYGHVFQARYKAILCEKQSYLLTLLRYIHLNPVKARLCARPEDWPWSGHHAYLKPEPTGLVDSAFPLSCFSDDLSRAQRDYLKFVEASFESHADQEFRTETRVPCLGSDEFVSHFLELADRRTKPLSCENKSLERVAQEASKRTGVPILEIRSGGRRRTLSAAKRLFASLAIQGGCRLAQVATFLNCSSTAAAKLLSTEAHG